MSMRHLLLATAVAALAACGGTEAANETANAANGATVEAPAAAPAANETVNAAAPAAASGDLSMDYMVGKWSAMDEKCDETIEFKKDGTVMTPIGPAKWTLVGDQLTFDYGDGSTQKPSTIKVISPERIEITRGSTKETQKRC